jgi:Ankyrin repeats (3 copies)
MDIQNERTQVQKNESELIMASYSGDVETMRSVLESGLYNVDELPEALYNAIGNRDIAELLIDAGAPMTLEILRKICGAGYIETFRLLVSKFPDSSVFNDYESFLFEIELLKFLIMREKFEVVKYLVESGFQIDVEWMDHILPVAVYSTSQILEYILDVTSPSKGQVTEALATLPDCMYRSDVCAERAKILIKCGADVHYDDDYLICWASENGNIEVVKVLIEAGANVDARNSTPLKSAREHGRIDIVNLLLSAGAYAL